MSDIVERLRAWVYTDSQYATALEAADEIERLRALRDEDGKQMSALIEGYQKMQAMCIDGKYLTDAEREAVEYFSEWCIGPSKRLKRYRDTLRGLLERMK